jgi:hypothetical protein
MKKIQIIEQVENEDILEISEESLLKKIKVEGLASIIKQYEIPEDFIIKNHNVIDKDIIIEHMILSENFIIESITIGYMDKSDISNLNMMTYSKLSKSFLKKFEENINWQRMILYLSSSELIDVWKYVDIIEKNNLWNLISANDLDIEFIRNYKTKLNWQILSLVKCFNEEELLEFSEYIPEKKNFDDSFLEMPSVSEIREVINMEFGDTLNPKLN